VEQLHVRLEAITPISTPFCPMQLEVVAQVEQRLLQRLPLTKQERDQQSSDTSVTVEEWMNRLKLSMYQSAKNEHGDWGLIVKKCL
jgi:hypothetical protein